MHTCHCGRNTHFMQIYFAVPNFKFIYIYIKLKKLRDAPRIFWRNTQKLAIRENCASEENKCTLIVDILQVKTLIAIVYRPQEKNLQITLNALWIFIIIHHFCMATFGQEHMASRQHSQHLMDIYLYSVSINRMLISQLKRFLGVKFMFPHRFNV